MEQPIKRVKTEIHESFSLPYDIWNLIFRLLHRTDLKQFALASKTCKSVLNQSLLKLDVSDYRPTHETEIDTPNINAPFPPSYIECIITCFSNLTALNLSFTLIDDKGLTLLPKLSKLRRLSLSKCLFITIEGISSCISSLNDLTHLDLSYNHQLDGTKIFEAIEASPSSKTLIKLNVSSLLSIKAKSLFNIKKLIANATSWENLVDLVKSSKLEYLQLRWVPRLSVKELKQCCEELKITLNINADMLEIDDDTAYCENYMQTLLAEEEPLGPLNYYENLYSLKLLNKPLRPDDTYQQETFEYENAIVDIAKAQAFILFQSESFYDFFEECLSKGPIVVAEVLRVLGNSGKPNFSYFLFADGAPKILGILKEKFAMVENSSRPEWTWEVIENSLLALACCFKGRTPEELEEELSPKLDIFVPLLDHARPAIKLAAMSVITEISDVGGNPLNLVIDRGVVNKACAMLESDDPKMLLSALNIMGCISTGDDNQTQSVIDSGACPPMVKLLKHPDVQVSKRACWALSNITAGSSVQIKVVMDCGAFPIFVEMLAGGHDDEKREAAWALVNAMMPQNKEQLDKLVEVESVEYLMKYVQNVPNLPAALYNAIVRGFRNLAAADTKYTLIVKEKLTDDVLAILMANTDYSIYQTLNDAINKPELEMQKVN